MQSWDHLILTLVLVAIIVPTTATTQHVSTDLWDTDGEVHAIATDGNTVYVGGDFDYVGPHTGAWAAVDTSGVAFTNAPVYGRVFCAVPDGLGGWYIGGNFGRVGGRLCSNLAHILHDGSVASWIPATDAPVLAVARVDSILYVGGQFTTVAGQGRSYLAAVDARTGALEQWDPGADSWVQTLNLRGSVLYAGGLFATLGSQARSYIGAFDAHTGELSSWAPSVNGPVQVIAATDSTVFVGGSFTMIDGELREYAAELNATNGTVTPWTWSSQSGLRSWGPVEALVVTEAAVYVGGDFVLLGRPHQGYIAALERDIGVEIWRQPTDLPVECLAVDESTVYAGGRFTSPRHHVASFTSTTGRLASWAPGANGPVHVVATAGASVYLGGDFTSTGGKSRSNLAALDVSTGEPMPWAPAANNAVHALVLHGTSIYVGGDFSRIGVDDRQRVAELDAVTGTATPWNPNASGPVYALAVNEATVYVAGWFSSIGGQSRRNVAAVDAATGIVTPWAPVPNGQVNCLSLSGSTLFAGGTFTQIGARSRGGVAAFDVLTDSLTSWNAPVGGSLATVNALAMDGSVLYIGGRFNTVGSERRMNIAAVDAVTGAVTTWSPALWGALQTIVVNDARAYIGGSFNRIGDVLRDNVAVLETKTGLPTPWNADTDDRVTALAVNGRTVYMGGDFRLVRGEFRRGLVAIHDSVSVGVQLHDLSARQDGSDVVLRWRESGDTRVAAFRIMRSHKAGALERLSPDLQYNPARTYQFRDIEPPTGSYAYHIWGVGERGVIISRRVVEVSVVQGRSLVGLLEPAVPNPFTDSTMMRYSLAHDGAVELAVFDTRGRRVRALRSDPHGVAGSHSVRWAARDDAGRRVASGVYYVWLRFAGRVWTRQLIVLQ
jgi:hypothetical protein